MINPLGDQTDRPIDRFIEPADDSIAVLGAGLGVFEVGPIVVGQAGHYSNELEKLTVAIETNGLSVWKNEYFMSMLGSAGTSILFLGGQWLEEEILISAIQATILGYDVRVLIDLSKAKCETEREAASHRLTQYGVLKSTVRQMLLEWAVTLDDPDVLDHVRTLLSRPGASAQA